MSEFFIRVIQKEDLDAIAHIHKASFHDRALSQLGFGAIKRYYKWLLTGFSEIYPLCAVNLQGKLAGYCFAGQYAGSFSGFLSANKWYLVGTVFLQPWLIFNPIVLDQIKVSVRTLKKMIIRQMKHKNKLGTKKITEGKSKTATSLGILSIAVSPAFQRQGVGELLMQEVEKFAYINCYTELHLSVRPENLPAVKFYEKLGWQKSPLDGNWDGKMFKKLA